MIKLTLLSVWCFIFLGSNSVCFADENVDNKPSSGLLDQLIGSNRAGYKPTNEDVALLQNMMNLLNDSKKMTELVSIFGDKKCIQSFMSDSTKLSGLLNLFEKSSDPNVVLNDQKKITEMMSQVKNNDCLKEIIKDKEKLKKLANIFGDVKLLQSFQLLMNSNDRVPKLIEYIKSDRALSDKLANTQFVQIANIFGDKCIQALTSNKDKFKSLMGLFNKNPSEVMNDPKKISEIKQIFEGTDCLQRIVNNQDKLKQLMGDVKGLDSLQSLLDLKKVKRDIEADNQSPVFFNNKNIPYIFQELLNNKTSGYKDFPKYFDKMLNEGPNPSNSYGEDGWMKQKWDEVRLQQPNIMDQQKPLWNEKPYKWNNDDN